MWRWRDDSNTWYIKYKRFLHTAAYLLAQFIFIRSGTVVNIVFFLHQTHSSYINMCVKCLGITFAEQLQDTGSTTYGVCKSVPHTIHSSARWKPAYLSLFQVEAIIWKLLIIQRQHDMHGTELCRLSKMDQYNCYLLVNRGYQRLI